LAARSPRRASPVRGVRDRLERRYLGEGEPVPLRPVGEAHPGCAAVTGLLGLPYHTRVLSRPRAGARRGILRVEAIELLGIGSLKQYDIYVGMAAQPDLEVQTEFETSGILTGRVGNRDIDSARRIDNGHALPCPQEREQIVDERRVAEMDVHGAAVMALPPLGALSERGRALPSMQAPYGGPKAAR
jgi:hypothetical protein